MTYTIALVAIEVAWFGVTNAINLHPAYGLSGMLGIALAWPRKW